MLRRLTVNNFAKKVGFKNGKAYGFKGQLHALEKLGIVEIKQAGYRGDSLHHPKVVVIKDMEAVERRFNLHDFEKDRAPRYVRKLKCRHRDLSVVAVVSEVPMSNPPIRKVVLKCGHCEYHVERLQVSSSSLEVFALHPGGSDNFKVLMSEKRKPIVVKA